jgi:hypothetical protein
LQQPRCPSVGEWINKHLDNGILFNIINKWTIKPWKYMEENT